MGGRVWTKGELVPLGGLAQLVVDQARLGPREALFGVELVDIGHVLRRVEDDGDVRRFAREARAAATVRYGGAVFATARDRGNHIVDVQGLYDAEWRHPEVRGVGGPDRSGPGIEADLTADVLPQRAFQRCDVN